MSIFNCFIAGSLLIKNKLTIMPIEAFYSKDVKEQVVFSLLLLIKLN